MRIISSSPTSLDCAKWVVISLRLRLWRVLACFAPLKPRAVSEKLRRIRESHRLRRGEMLGAIVEA